MSKIFKLDTHLVNQISAGEVVERPISVVKELLENSIDAWATSIKIEVTQWWIEEIIISDNGLGIAKNDLLKATQKYTTSKIKNLDDLYNVMTFWFRWEALASIASVSQLTIISKTVQQESAWSLSIIDGQHQAIQQDVLETGTRVIIKGLFWNIPARFKLFKKTPNWIFTYS